MEASTTEGHDLTSGHLHRNIWYLAVPMMLETGILNVAQVLDTYWVGRLGSAALAAVTISITIRWVVNSLANGLGIGGMAVVARRIGARDREAAEHAAWQAILLGIFVSLALGLLGIAIARPPSPVSSPSSSSSPSTPCCVGLARRAGPWRCSSWPQR